MIWSKNLLDELRYQLYRVDRRDEGLTEFQRMVQLLDAAWLLRGEIVPCLVGPPGIGKTAAVEHHARNHG
jgi:MoxR-like ATPase